MKKQSDPIDVLDDELIPSESRQEPVNKKLRLTIGIAAALLICALAVALPSLLQAAVPPVGAENAATPGQAQTSALPAGNSELAVTVYAVEWKETVLQPDVTIALNEYSPLQSSVPGLPFIITAGGEDLGKDSIRVDVNAGSLITWNPPDYSVKQRGNTYVVSSGDTVYWSPLDAQGDAIGQCQMTVTAFDSENQAHAVTIAISQTSDYNYTAEIKK